MLGKQADARISAPSVSEAWPFHRLRATLSGVEGWQALGVTASGKATAGAAEAKRRRGPQRKAREDAR
jgi:hypothetical protein